MAEQQTSPFELLKSFSGIVHRQPIFVANRLDVDSYHLSFLDKHGQKLNDDSKVPSFIEQLPNILPEISNCQTAMLSMPESWREALYNTPRSSFKLILDINGHAISETENARFCFASHARQDIESHTTDTLLINMQRYEAEKLVEYLPHWRENHQKLCATNVNNIDLYTFCKSQDIDLLQGQFYTLPSVKKEVKILPSQRILMELLVKLQDPKTEPDNLAETINQDIALSYKLLRLINSAFFGLPREISSIKQAIVILGEKKIKTWASLLCLTGVDDKPVELRVVAMARARMCELLTKYYKGAPELFFAAGLFSTLDALVDKPLSEIISQLPLSVELSNALLDRTGTVGQALNDVLNYEKNDWLAVDSSPISTDVLSRAYLDAINWAKELNSQIV